MYTIRLMTLAALFVLTGCATKNYVHEYVNGQLQPVNARASAHDEALKGIAGRLDGVAAGLNGQNARLASVEGSLAGVKDQVTATSRTAQDALDRAMAAGKLAAGKLMYEVVLTDDAMRFALGRAELTAAARQSLDTLVTKLKAENANVFIEIQGHTDSRGSAAGNHALGLKRADAVREYLAIKGGLPLHRLNVISYGDAAPLASNKTRAGRMQNRRVVLVVLK